MTTSANEPCAAPATASTLSSPMAASAMTMVCMAPQKRAAAFTSWPTSPSCGLEQLVGDPDEDRAARGHEARDAEQPHHGERHDEAHGDGADGAPEDGALRCSCRGSVAGGERDHDRVVAGEREVDHDDGGERREELREKIHPISEVVQRLGNVLFPRVSRDESSGPGGVAIDRDSQSGHRTIACIAIRDLRIGNARSMAPGSAQRRTALKGE